ncbi:dihydrolipoyl dehydrogenase family protein [Hoyosella subflava]|uniref:FAD-dependent pyridine nucleotide-disulfide oxidoreductase n=1 Tax=Hoyosella subflava (strain DSM 45089 / JCM 17490 / NBRC 109087 / DQS3-9A1) TaxID=443218 RepID=F6EK46_HOYSD|nr:NAD(P)/FAD-dependent oxidoreductase [Hoyosella subflava]AEF42587.1 FAD-dependent pyridine nucleotide-disulfide oxidoreductase [Hoyosella subflava DQS3-9A1]
MKNVETKVWDLLVVGGGSAGIVAAKTAVKLGASVLLAEQQRPGGDCLWTGCVPSKSLLAAAHHRAGIRKSAALGVHAQGVTVDFAAVRQHVNTAIRTIEPVDAPETLQAGGIHVVKGTVTFIGDGKAAIGGDRVAYRQAVIATGASPIVPRIPGLRDFLTSETIWGLTELPPRLLVLGGGSVGCELSQAFARLGSSVTLVEATDQILPAESPDAAAIIADSLRQDGVNILTGRALTEVTEHTAVLADRTRVEFDQLLIAVGRRARTAKLGLEHLGVAADEQGRIVVDRSMRTSNPRIWAAGDVTPLPQFTHTAGAFASIAASNAILGLRRKATTSAIPRVTFTAPEVASVGHTRAAHGTRQQTITHDHLDRAVTDDERRGFSRLHFDRKGRIVGATVVSPRAGETIGELTLAIRLGLRGRDLAGTIHPYPTFSDGAWNAAIADTRDQLDARSARRVIRGLARARSMWLRLRPRRH